VARPPVRGREWNDPFEFRQHQTEKICLGFVCVHDVDIPGANQIA
jgi:hypothetical protein